MTRGEGLHETALRINSLPSPPAGEGSGVRGARRLWPRFASGHCAGALALLLASATIAQAAGWTMEGGRTPSPKKEADLIAVLKSDAPKAKKADACKDLAIYGSPKAVPELARLLADEQLASWARIAIEAIPGAASDAALRKAVGSLKGLLLVGAINSIGVRRDPMAVGPLTTKLTDKDAVVASAAAVALGHIGDADAAKALQQVLASAPPKVRSSVAEGLVLCAERSLKEARAEEAVALYEAVRNADVPEQRHVEATRGAILARKDQGIPLLVEQLKSSDKKMFQLALGTAREFPGSQVDQSLANEIAQLAPERAALLIGAMADRKATVVLAALLKAAEHGQQPVRLAAIGALGRVGNDSCVDLLLNIALDPDADLGKAAKAALIDLSDPTVDQDLVTRLRGAQGKTYPLLIELVGERRIKAIDELVSALDNSDDTVRIAALRSLGTTVPADKLSVLITQFVTPKHAEDATEAEKALKAACVRMPDREACAKELSAAMQQAPVATKIALLKILGAVGGTEALASVGTAAKTSEPELQDASSRLLGEWMTIDAAPVLLDLSKTADGDKYRVRALRGYLRMARQFAMPEAQRIEMCEKAMAAAIQRAEQKLVLDVLKLKKYQSPAVLQVIAKFTRDYPKLNHEASQAALFIGRELGDEKHSSTADEVRDILSHAKLEKVTLEIVSASYGAGDKKKDVTKTLQKLAKDVQLISLPSPNYVAVFGGDPAPGTIKQLTVNYKINGKADEAYFGENAVVILPMPR
jgi:HEAT repeat protein